MGHPPAFSGFVWDQKHPSCGFQAVSRVSLEIPTLSCKMRILLSCAILSHGRACERLKKKQAIALVFWAPGSAAFAQKASFNPALPTACPPVLDSMPAAYPGRWERHPLATWSFSHHKFVIMAFLSLNLSAPLDDRSNASSCFFLFKKCLFGCIAS